MTTPSDPHNRVDSLEELKERIAVLWNTRTPAQPPQVQGWQMVKVNEAFSDLVNALERADRKGYLAEALIESWEAFDYEYADDAAPEPPVQETARNPDVLALNAAREIMALMYGPTPLGGSPQLLAQVQCVVSEAIVYAAPQPSDDVAKDAWIPVSERLPDVEKGKHKFVLVSVYRARSQRSFVFMLTFANEYEVQNDGYIDGDAEYVYLSGWYDTNDEGDFFQFVKYDEADKLTHWMPLPAAPIAGGVE